MWTLGLHIGSLHRDTDVAHRLHSNFDSAAALLHDGVVVAASRESTLAGVARDKRFPAQAIEFCLETAGRSLHDVDAIALDQDEAALDAIALQRALDDAREPMRGGRGWIASLFAASFEADVATILHFVDHTTAHLRAAFVGSGFERATSLCLDGAGAEALAVIADQDLAGVRVLKRVAPGCSLADLIDMAGELFAFGGTKAADLGAVAAGGDPARYRDVLRKMHAITPDGELYLRERAERLQMLRDAGVLQASAQASAAERLLIRRDMAAAVQVALGDLVEHLLRKAHSLSACRDLCVAGEIAHDPYLVGRALRAAAFDRVWIAPVADDAGNAIGSAAHVAGPAARIHAATQMRWGRDFAQQDVALRLAAWNALVVSQRVSDPALTLAQHLAEGRTIAWLQGRSEWNARDLSSRAILSDPRRAAEGAESNVACICRASIPVHFECAEAAGLPRYVTYCLTPRTGASPVPATLRNSDGTVTLCAIDAADAHLHGAIEAFERLTGLPCVLSRPFVGLGGTPVDNIDAAIACLLAHPIDAMIVNDCLVRRREPAPPVPGVFADLVPRLARERELVRVIPNGDSTEYAIALRHDTEAVGNDRPVSLPISRAAFDLLHRHNAQTRLHDVLGSLTGEAAADGALYDEVIEGWRCGFVELHPPERSEV